MKLHDSIIWSHVPRGWLQNSNFSLEGLSNFMTKMFFSGVYSFPHSRTAQENFSQESGWVFMDPPSDGFLLQGRNRS